MHALERECGYVRWAPRIRERDVRGAQPAQQARHTLENAALAHLLERARPHVDHVALGVVRRRVQPALLVRVPREPLVCVARELHGERVVVVRLVLIVLSGKVNTCYHFSVTPDSTPIPPDIRQVPTVPTTTVQCF